MRVENKWGKREKEQSDNVRFSGEVGAVDLGIAVVSKALEMLFQAGNTRYKQLLSWRASVCASRKGEIKSLGRHKEGFVIPII